MLAYASSLDQIGPLAHDAADAAAVLQIIAAEDKRDSTSVIGDTMDILKHKPVNLENGKFNFLNCIADKNAPDDMLKGLSIGIPSNYFGDGLDSEVNESVLAAARLLRDHGASRTARCRGGARCSLDRKSVV